MPNTKKQELRLAQLSRFGANPGSLNAWLYLPSILVPGSPLVVALHGCTQTAADYAVGSGWSELAERNGFAVVYPEQQRSNNANVCFNWFEPGDTGRNGAGEAQSIRQMVDHLIETQAIDPKRIFVTGLSAGGAMANVMLATYPETFAGGAIIGGLPYGAAGSVGEAFQAMQGRNAATSAALQSAVKGAAGHKGRWPTVSVWHGTHDQTVRPVNAEQIAAQWHGAHKVEKQPSRVEELNGHSRKLWLDKDGRVAVELFLVKGMAHGVPLAAEGEAPIGKPGPYMLEARISSTARIARSWGLATDADVAAAEAPGHSERPKNASKAAPGTDKSQHRVPPQSANDAAPDGKIAKVINDALRAAGLMR